MSTAQATCTDGIAASTSDTLLLIGRVLLGWLFLYSGWGKLFGGIDGFIGYLKNLSVPAPEVFSWIGALVEFIVGVTLILGLGTRYAALLCVVAAVISVRVSRDRTPLAVP